jgi:hypothetical protein
MSVHYKLFVGVHEIQTELNFLEKYKLNKIQVQYKDVD